MPTDRGRCLSCRRSRRVAWRRCGDTHTAVSPECRAPPSGRWPPSLPRTSVSATSRHRYIPSSLTPPHSLVCRVCMCQLPACQCKCQLPACQCKCQLPACQCVYVSAASLSVCVCVSCQPVSVCVSCQPVSVCMCQLPACQCVMLSGVRGLTPPGVCGETAGRRVTVDRCVYLCCNKMTCCVRCVRNYTARCL